MPYITVTNRAYLDETLDKLKVNMLELTYPKNEGVELTAGTLNYIFTKVALAYIDIKGMRYQNANDIMGALEGANKELYRRVFAQYEDTAISKNGDLPEFEKLEREIDPYTKFLARKPVEAQIENIQIEKNDIPRD